jgi:hypothetical protein
MNRVLLIILGLVVASCRIPAGAGLPAAGPAAQRTLERFAVALEKWNIGEIEKVLVGGAVHPAWRIQKSTLEGRGIRFAETKAGLARQVEDGIAVGPVRFRLTGNSVDDKVRVTRVALLQVRGEWKVSFWGHTLPVRRHLRWLRMGGDPLKDPSFNYLR